MAVFTYLLLHTFIGAILVLGGLRENRRFLYVAGFLIPLQGLTFDFFVNFSWYKLIFPAAILVVLLRGKIKPIQIPNRPLLYFLMFYMGAVSIFFGIYTHFFTPLISITQGLGWGLAQTTYRYHVQFVTYLFVWGLAFVGFWFVRSRSDLVAVMKGYVGGSLLSICSGFYQIVAVAFDLPWFRSLDYTRFLTERLTTVNVVIGDISINRLYGLGGEPKHTAGYTVIAIALLAALMLEKRSPIKHSFLIMQILVMGVILTGSTSGWLGLLIVLTYFSLQAIRQREPRRVLGYLFVPVTFLLVLTATLGGASTRSFYESRMTSRLSGGLDSFAANEYKDGALIAYAKEYPSSMIFGHGAGGVDFRLLPYAEMRFLIRGAMTPAYLLTRTLGDFGIVGVMTLLFLMVRWAVFTKEHGEKQYSNFIVAGLISLVFIPYVAFAGYLLIVSCMVASVSASIQASSKAARDNSSQRLDVLPAAESTLFT